MKKMMTILLAAAMLMVSASALALTDSEVEQTARAYVPAQAELTRVKMDDGLYEADFVDRSSGITYDVKVDPLTGEAVRFEMDSPDRMGALATTLTEEQIKEAVQKEYPGATVVRYDERIDDGWHEIEVFFYAEGVYGTLELNAESGTILDADVYFGDYTDGSVLTQDAAIAALASLKPGVEVVKIELDEDDGRSIWEGDAKLDGKRYEFELDAASGTLIEWERD